MKLRGMINMYNPNIQLLPISEREFWRLCHVCEELSWTGSAKKFFIPHFEIEHIVNAFYPNMRQIDYQKFVDLTGELYNAINLDVEKEVAGE